MEDNNRTIVQKLIIGSGYSYFPLITQKAIGIVTSVFLARTLGPSNLGMISIINYLLLLVLFFTGMGIPIALVKLIAEYQTKKENRLDNFILSAFLTNFLIILLITILYYFFASFIANQIYHEPRLSFLIKLSSIAIFFFSLNQFGNSVIQGLAEFKKLSALLILNSIAGLLFLIPLTKFFGLKGAVLSQAITSFITFCFLLWIVQLIRKKYSLDWQLKIINPKLNITNIKRYLLGLAALALPVFISGLAMNPVLPILTAILSRFHSLLEVGFFNISYSLTQLVLFVPTAVGTAFVPLATKLATENITDSKDFLLKTIYGVTIIVMLLSFILSFFSREIIMLFYGTKYSQAQNFLMLLSLVTFLISFGNIIGYYLLAIGKMWLATLLNFIWFILIIAPAFYFIRHFGLIGLGFTYLISYLILTTIFVIYLKQRLKINVNQIILYLGGGSFFLLSIFLIKILKIPNLFYIGLFILFLISFYLLCSRILNRKLFSQLASFWLRPANESK